MSEQLNIEGKVYRQIKTANINQYMRHYSKMNYSKNKLHIRRLKNTRNLLKQYNVNEEIKNRYGEYLYDLKVLLEIISEMPPDLLRYSLEEITNDNIFIKKSDFNELENED